MNSTKLICFLLAAALPCIAATNHFKVVSPTELHGTVVVGVAVSEGLVLVGDSRVTAQNPAWNPSYKVISDNQYKVMSVGKFGLATYGAAFVLDRSIAAWVSDFELELRKSKKLDNLAIDGFIKEFISYFEPKVQEQKKSMSSISVGFLAAGYDAGGIGRIYAVTFPDPHPVERANTTGNGAGMTWEGETDTIQRIILGYDAPRFFSLPTPKSWSAEARQKLAVEIAKNLQYKVFYQVLSLQDAVDLSTFLVQATVTMQRFSFGTEGNLGSLPDVGGPVDTLAITPNEVKWVQHKMLGQSH